MNTPGDVPNPIATVDLPDAAATAAFAEDVATCLTAGDIVTLSGGLGVGKTTLARALLRAIGDDPALEVPSPTFTLVQTYAGGRLTVSHFDLYRLATSDELDEIGFADAALEGAVLVEWPERAGGRLPAERLDIALAIAGGGRRATVGGQGTLPTRLRRSRAARAFLEGGGWRGAARRHLQGDASSRTYERIRAGERRAVLMDWPPRGQLPAGDPRARYRARDARAFVAVDHALRAAGVSAPEIYAADLAAGFVLMEDFGDEGLIVASRPDFRRYGIAIEMLAELHAKPRPAALPLPDGSLYRLPPLGRDALAAEIATFVEAYVPHAAGEPLPDDAKAEFLAIWAVLFDKLAAAEKSWVLFDVQSPNLFWLPEREGVARIGVIDFQDMFLGPSAYDVASLCQDARITIPADVEWALRDRYVALRRAGDPGFDADSFMTAYAIAAAVRAVKNLGVFAGLAGAGKPHYLNHLPRMSDYLARAFAHPVLSPLAVWYEKRLNP